MEEDDGRPFGVLPALLPTAGGSEKPYMLRGVFTAESELSPPLGEKIPWPVGE